MATVVAPGHVQVAAHDYSVVSFQSGRRNHLYYVTTVQRAGCDHTPVANALY